VGLTALGAGIAAIHTDLHQLSHADERLNHALNSGGAYLQLINQVTQAYDALVGLDFRQNLL
jgi:hypothetical protein